MNFKQIASLPTSISLSQSQFRSAAILDKVKELLRHNTPPNFVFEFIESMESADFNQSQATETLGVSHLRKAESGGGEDPVIIPGDFTSLFVETPIKK